MLEEMNIISNTSELALVVQSGKYQQIRFLKRHVPSCVMLSLCKMSCSGLEIEAGAL